MAANYHHWQVVTCQNEVHHQTCDTAVSVFERMDADIAVMEIVRKKLRR